MIRTAFSSAIFTVAALAFASPAMAQSKPVSGLDLDSGRVVISPLPQVSDTSPGHLRTGELPKSQVSGTDLGSGSFCAIAHHEPEAHNQRRDICNRRRAGHNTHPE